MKRLLLPLLFVSVYFSIHAQIGPKLVGMVTRGGDFGAGGIFKYTGGDTVISLSLSFPATIGQWSVRTSTLTQADNGKFYGVLAYDGPLGKGSLIEYDYYANSYIVKAYFDTTTGYFPSGGLLKANNGLFYGYASFGPDTAGTLFSYVPGSHTITRLITFPHSANCTGTPIQASNGKLYGLTNGDGAHNTGTIFEYDIATSSYNVLYNFPYDNPVNPGDVVEVGNDTLYGVVNAGPLVYTPGSIFRYVISTGVYADIYDFAGQQPTGGGALNVTFNPLTLGKDGLIYAMTYNGFDSLDTYTGQYDYSQGDIYSFNIDRSTFTNLHYFNTLSDGLYPQGELFQASDNKFYGMTPQGGAHMKGVIFQYDPIYNVYSKKFDFDTTTVYDSYLGGFTEYKQLSPFYLQPSDISVCPNSVAEFFAVDTSSAATVQWQVSTDSGSIYTNVSGATDTIYSFTATAQQNAYQYRAVFSHGGQSDTTIPAILKIWQAATISDSLYICSGGAVTVGTHTYTSAGVYIDTIIGGASHGCDSIVATHLFLVPYSIYTQTFTLCTGESITVGPHIYYTSGNYTDTLQGPSLSGCDSIVLSNLTFLPMAVDTIAASICPGQGYSVAGSTYTVSGVYSDTLQNVSVNGCDSIVTLLLDVYPPADTTIIQTVCPGGGYTIGTNSYTLSGVYTDTLIGAAIYGCDSIVTLDLNVITDTVTAYFTLQPSGTPHLWYAVNQSTGAGLIYVWSWGDSTTSTGDTPSHIYITAGNYNVCVTATDSIGCSATYCDTNVYLFKDGSGQMINVEVVTQLPTGISTMSTDNLNINYYVGAVHFSEVLQAPTQLRLYDMSGRMVQQQNGFGGSIWNINSDIASGVYIVQLQNGSNSLSKKLIVTR